MSGSTIQLSRIPPGARIALTLTHRPAFQGRDMEPGGRFTDTPECTCRSPADPAGSPREQYEVISDYHRSGELHRFIPFFTEHFFFK
jgi:hypothetical protein